MRRACWTAGSALGAALVGPWALAVDVPDYDFEWCVIGDPGNPGYPAWDQTKGPWFWVGPGTVRHVYRIAKTETTTAQWVEFYNALAEHEPAIAWDERPWFWGARLVGPTFDPRWEVGPEQDDWRRGAIVPLRAAARLCNWLHNGKARERWAFMDGAYDATTFGYDADLGDITDDYTRREGALFFVPSPEEWIKAVYYDPNRHAPGEGGWWRYPDSSDEVLVAGLPGEPGAETIVGVGVTLPWHTAVGTPLMSYPQTTTPWGLLDASGPLSEWTDRFAAVHFITGTQYTWIGSNGLWTPHAHFTEYPDHIVSIGADDPEDTFGDVNLRVASVVPCTADFATPYGVLDLRDITAFVEAYLAADPSAEISGDDGAVGPEDALEFISRFAAGCAGELEVAACWASCSGPTVAG